MKPAVIIALVVVLILVAAVLYVALSSSSTSTPSVPAPSAPSPSGSSGTVATPQASSGTTGHKTFCEQDFASNNISCPAGTNLTLNKFQYWRSGGGCKYPQDPNRSFPDCAGKDYAGKMQGMVQGGNLTFAKAINDILGEDPCPNIYKQVDVDYTCR